LLAEHYNKILYPLQDKVFPLFNNIPFYLIGGTTLSRGYYNHRYSEDLDYFLNDHPDFQRIADIQVEKLLNTFTIAEIDIKGKHFYRLFVGQEKLKIEMVNDVPAHVGQKVNHPLLGIIDSKENILANKLTAIVDRTLPKDIVDIFFLLNDGLNLKDALLNAESKAAGISPLLIAKIFSEFDYSLIDSEIKWVTPVESIAIKKFLNIISEKIVKGSL
jgi:predicted nucleotidyltransferase component of viral defense system